MTIDTAALRALAEKATPGSWLAEQCEDCGDWHVVEARWKHDRREFGDAGTQWHPHVLGCDRPAKSKGNALFAAACSPSVILALLDEVEKMAALRNAYAAVDFVDEMFPGKVVLRFAMPGDTKVSGSLDKTLDDMRGAAR